MASSEASQILMLAKQERRLEMREHDCSHPVSDAHHKPALGNLLEVYSSGLSSEHKRIRPKGYEREHRIAGTGIAVEAGGDSDPM